MVYGKDGSVRGVMTNDFGVSKGGSRKDGFTLGMALTAQATLFAEGCRGSLSEVGIALGLGKVWEGLAAWRLQPIVWPWICLPQGLRQCR